MKTTGIAMWAYTKEADTKFEPQWRITLLLSDAEAKKLKDLGVVVKRNDDGAWEYKFKRKVKNAKGFDNEPPRVVDAAKNTFNGIIGNGSIVNVQFKPFQWKFKKGVGTDLVAVQIVDLVPYGGSGESGSASDEFEVLDGTDEFENEEVKDDENDF